MRAFFLVLVLLSFAASAQTLSSQYGTLSGQGVYDLLIKIQFEAKSRLDWKGKVRVTLIAPRIVDGKILEALDKLSHGWADCSKAFLGIGCNMIAPVPTQVITGQVNRETWRFLAQLRWYKDDLMGKQVAAELWLLPGEVKSGLLLLETADEDYILTGLPLGGLAGSITYYKARGIGKVMRDQINLGQILKQAHKWIP